MRPRVLLMLAACLNLALLLAVSQAGDESSRSGAKSQDAGDPKNAGSLIQALSVPGIVFVGAPIFDEQTDGGDGVYQGSYHWRDGYIYPRSATFHRGERTMGPPRPGRNLYSLVPAKPDGKLTRLTHLKTGSVFKPEPSYDGKKVLFAMRRDGEDWFHLCEVNVDGTGLKQLTDGPFNDFGGVYLPDGRIVFCSDRTGYLEEYHEERTETLFVMKGDGTGIHQITFMPGTYFEPSVLRDGRIMFSFWDAFHIDVPPFDKHETYLMTVNPDGSEERHLFGAGQYRFFNRERHSGIGLTQAHELPDGRILVQSEMGPSLIDLRAGLSVPDALAPIFPGTTSVQVGGTTHRVHLSPLGTRSTPYPVADGRFLFSATLPGARDSAIYVCDPDSREETPIINIPNYAEFDPVPVLVERPKPAILPTKVTTGSQAGAWEPVAPLPAARFLVVAGRTADNPRRAEALKRARYFRVVEAEYGGVTTSSHTNLETRILGTVPIEDDGSVYFEVPADTPVFLDPIDAGGNRVLMEWNYPNTDVAEGLPYPATQMAYMVGRAGETKSCYGCHATQTEAVPNTPLKALKHGPVRVSRETTDIQYRRNEPNAYRRQARIGESAKFRAWLSDTNPVLRARGCEMLMFIEDGAESDVPAISKLLTDESVEVRRAAALALTRLGTSKDLHSLQEAAKDNDWQVGFSASTALEAITGRKGQSKQAEPIQDHDLVFENLSRQPASEANTRRVIEELRKAQPSVLAIRAAGKLRHAPAIPLLKPWLTKHEWEYHAAEAAVALGRIGTPEAIATLWEAVRSEVPNRKVHISRYLQHGPRPEEYALVQGLIIAGAVPEMRDIHLLIALLPNTFTEKPRYEDRLRSESQRILMPRLLLERMGCRQEAVSLLVSALKDPNGEPATDTPLHQQIIRGINLERPFSEHGRPFEIVKRIGPEEALWLLSCFLDVDKDFKDASKREQLEALVVPYLTSENHRERIDAAVVLGKIGFGSKGAAALAAEIAKPYAFPEIASMGKGMPDKNFRDKAYLVQALAQHISDVNDLRPFADPRKMTRDIRYGLTHGLAFRGKPDGIPLLAEMAVRDPITLVRQQARYGIDDIRDVCRLAGKQVPAVVFPEPVALEALYPPRDLTWSDTQFIEFDRNSPPDMTASDALALLAKRTPAPKDFRNLNNAQASGAERMMIAHVEEFRSTFVGLGTKTQGESELLTAALDSPYPFAHYAASSALAQRADRSAVPKLIAKLELYAKSQQMVGFWWCCEALANLRAKEALPSLLKYAVPQNPAGTFGSPGMATGYIAAKAYSQINGDVKDRETAKLLGSANVWIRAGALRGLAEAPDKGIEAILRQAADEDNPALVRHEAQVQLRRLQLSNRNQTGN